MNKMRALWLTVGVAALVVVGLACGDKTAPGPPQDGELVRPALANDEVAVDGSWGVQSYPPDQTADVGNLEKELRHAQLQDPVGPLQVELAVKEAGTFAGLWIEWEPEFRVVVLFTRDGEETIRPYIENRPFADDVEVRTARMTLVELQNAQAAANRAVSDLGIAFGSRTNVKENRVELYVTDPVAVDKALREANTQLPDYVELVKVNEIGHSRSRRWEPVTGQDLEHQTRTA